ncbi:hypothetical protein [Terrabacter sp. BE26]|uniref:hypothetical protein n=1 Tax=Terrabacter sp. BE26 TaxID=2898152 RepID=UPI0035BEA17A
MSADDGACLMELVAMAAGEQWGDSPACTHPLLAHVARRVNDAISDDGRRALTSLIPALVGAHAEGAWVYAAIAAACTGTASERCPSSWLRALGSAATARADAGDTRRRWLYVHGMAYRSVDLAVFCVSGLEQREADEALRSMLEEAIVRVCADRSSWRSFGQRLTPLGVV